MHSWEVLSQTSETSAHFSLRSLGATHRSEAECGAPKGAAFPLLLGQPLLIKQHLVFIKLFIRLSLYSGVCY